MAKRVGSRAVIITDDKLLVMFRRKKGDDGSIQEYYVTPGGGQEENETLEETVVRELKEEFNVDIKIIGYLGKKENEKSINYFFHCEIINGTPKLGGEELERMTSDNFYEVREVPIKEIDNIELIGKEKVEAALNKEYEDLN